MSKLKYFLITNFLFFFILCTIKLFSQANMGGHPFTIHRELIATPSTFNMPTINNEYEVLLADSISQVDCSECLNKYYGKGFSTSIDIKSTTHDTIVDSTKIWTYNIKSSTAFGMQFYFDKFRLPFGAKIFIYNEDKSMILGVFTSDNNNADITKPIQFGTQWIKGNSIIFEYSQPLLPEFEGEIRISNVIHIFKDVFDLSGPFASGDIAPCEENVACYSGFGWDKEISSVALILGFNASLNLAAVCSGALINNTSEDGNPLFLSANHCIGNGSTNPLYDYGTWTFLFNHQSTNCSSTGSDVSSSLAQSVYGSFLLSNDALGSPTSDYLLLKLNTDKTTLSSYSVCYSGWDYSNSLPSSPFVGIHHPRGEIKKIADANVISSISSTHWGLNWTNGTAEPGSSGSPLFNSNHRIIGQLHKATGVPPVVFPAISPDFCDRVIVFTYGKFSESWTDGGFSYWLDPLITGQTTLDSYCPVPPNPTGGGGSGGTTASCDTRFNRDGFLINGQNEGVAEVCLSEGIKLNPAIPATCSFGTFHIETTIKQGKCSSITSEPNPYFCSPIPFTFGTKCKCTFYSLFIAVTECDYNLNPIGPEYNEWKNLDIAFSYIPQAIDLTSYLPSGVILQPNKYYKLKLASAGSGGWDEGTRYFHTYSDNIYLNGFALTGNVYSHDITLENISVNEAIDVVAKNSITLLPNSNLSLGTYEIDDVECNQFRETIITNNSYLNTNINTITRNESISKNDKVAPIKTNKSNLSVIPNPNSGSFKIIVATENQPNLIIEEITIYDIWGNKIWETQHSAQTSFEIDISSKPKGIYWIHLIDNNGKMQVEKIINQ